MKKVLVLLLLATSVLFAEVGFADEGGKISAYLRGSLESPDSVKTKLSSAGFTVLSESSVNAEGTLTSIVFTDDTLQSMANKNDRGFIASLRVLVDYVNKQISITNPIYFSKAFLQGEYDEAGAKAVLGKITSAFSGLSNSKDSLSSSKIKKYHFMIGMPYYGDMDTVANAGSSAELLEKLKAKGSKLIFTQKLSEDRILVGVALDSNVASFTKTIGEKNALVLPYPILLEGGKAKILAPKYYLAICYPMLSMSHFMKISATPAKIESDCKNMFK